MENTPSDGKANTSAEAKLKQLEEDAAKLAEKEQKLKEEIAHAQRELAAQNESTKEAKENTVSKIHHGVEPLQQDSGRDITHATHATSGKITVQLADCTAPAIPYDLSRPYERNEYGTAEVQKFLEMVSSGKITSRVIETDRTEANVLLARLEEERTHRRQKFSAYVELPPNALIGLPADELERKLFMRHFRNKEAQHRVFMIGFSVAIFCVIGAVLADVMNENNQAIVKIAAIIGAATTALGIAGHLVMRIGDNTAEKHAVRMIQELSVLDSILDHFRIALR